jgi:hypothetical protein
MECQQGRKSTGVETMNREIQMSATFQWQKAGDLVKVRGPLLLEGTWTGLDGRPTFYPREVIWEALGSALQKPLKLTHRGKTIGFITAVRRVDDGGEYEGVVFSKEAIEKIKSGELSGSSIEADVVTDRANGTEIAKGMTITAVALVENPACVPCRVERVAPVQLGSRRLPGRPGTLDRPGERIEVRDMSEEELAKPTREQFFQWLEEQLKAAGVPEEELSKIMDVLEAAIRTPYPYPYPKPYPYPYPYPAAKAAEQIEQTELAKPSRGAFMRWFRNQLKKAGLKADDIDKVIAILDMAIQTPYPYPYPKKMEEYEAELTEKAEKIAELEKELKEAQEKLGKVEEELNKFRQAELDRLIGEIKGFDSEFDEKKVLGSVECFDAKKTLLESYLAMVKKTKQTKLSVSDADNLEARVKKVIDEMGINIETILKR